MAESLGAGGSQATIGIITAPTNGFKPMAGLKLSLTLFHQENRIVQARHRFATVGSDGGGSEGSGSDGRGRYGSGVLTVALAAALWCAAGAALAQAYPSSPIKLIVPWPPGGGVDTSARIIVQPLAERLGQSIVIENRGGAGGNIGTEQAARAKADGYTLVMASSSPHAINPHIYSKLPFEPIKDFVPIAAVASVPSILVVPPNSPYKTVQDIIAAAKAAPGKLTYGSAGVGSSQHLAGAIFMRATGTGMLHVPYKGTAPAETDLMAGHVSLMLDTTACLPLVAGGKLRALAVASKVRNPALPNVPTFDELGVPNVYSSIWYGIAAPAGTPKEIVNRINTEVNALLQTPEMKRRMAEFGAEAGSGSPENYLDFWESEYKRFGEIVRLSGAKAD